MYSGYVYLRISERFPHYVCTEHMVAGAGASAGAGLTAIGVHVRMCMYVCIHICTVCTRCLYTVRMNSICNYILTRLYIPNVCMNGD
jgi:hypothetical protein